MESKPKKIRTQDRPVVLTISQDQLGDPTPSDYGTYHESSAKLLPKGMWKQERYEATLPARARRVPGLQLRNQPFLLTKGKDRSGLELNPTFPQSQLAESLPCLAVIEERNRLA